MNTSVAVAVAFFALDLSYHLFSFRNADDAPSEQGI